ncbi:MAG: uroporphyrinogen-III synthase [Acidimicrobiales bacterium]
MNVVVTREAGFNGDLVEWIGGAGDVVEAPLTTTDYRDVEEVAREIGVAAPYASLVVTSARARRYVAASRAALEEGASVFAVGPATAAMLADEGVSVDAASGAGALELVDRVSRGPVLMVGARESRDELPARLTARGLDVVRVAAYDTVALDVDDGTAWVLARADVVVVAAPSAWSVARTYVSSATWIVVPGETTAAAVRRDHARVVIAWGDELAATLAALEAS